jgi:hypothetical protein
MSKRCNSRVCPTSACRGRAEQRLLALLAVYRRASDAARWASAETAQWDYDYGSLFDRGASCPVS